MNIVLPGWSDLQHYKDRDPTWVKLYRDILTTESWVLGTDASRLVQIACILLAARYQNATPLNFALFRKVASLDLTERQFTESIEYLSCHKFLEIQGEAHSASTTLAECSSEKRREEKRRGEERQKAARNCPDDFGLTDEMREWASKECPQIDIDRETATFKDYTFATPRSDWLKTWRNWMRKAKPANGRPLTKYEQSMKALEEWGSNDTGTDQAPLALTGPNLRTQVR
jgi:hypothetical protein